MARIFVAFSIFLSLPIVCKQQEIVATSQEKTKIASNKLLTTQEKAELAEVQAYLYEQLEDKMKESQWPSEQIEAALEFIKSIDPD